MLFTNWASLNILVVQTFLSQMQNNCIQKHLHEENGALACK